MIQRLVNLEFSYDYICTACKEINAYPQNECPYKKQFENLKSFPFVLAHSAYAFTKRIAEYDPQHIVVDDCLMYIKVHPTKDELETQLQFLTNLTNRYQKINSKITLLELNQRPDYVKFMNKLKFAHKKYINEIVEEAKNKNWNKNCSGYDKLFLISPDDIDTYCKLAKVHGYQEQFATPMLFYLFDYVYEQKKKGNEVQLTIIDAKPNINFLEILAKRYRLERSITINFEPDNFKPNLVDHGSVVYRVGRKDAWYPIEESIEKNPKIRENIRKRIAELLDYFYNNNFNQKIGVVMKKPSLKKPELKKLSFEEAKECNMRRFVPNEFRNVEIETFGNVRGKNSLENCDPLFVIGTYSRNKDNIERDFIHWHAHKPTTLETVENGAHGGYYHYVDKELDSFRQQFEEIEMYQAIHRSRLWLSKKQVFVFGIVPTEIMNEGVKVVRIKGGWGMNRQRREWLMEKMKKAKEEIASWTRDDMADYFGISEDYAYREIKTIVESSKELHLEKRRNIWWLVYE